MKRKLIFGSFLLFVSLISKAADDFFYGGIPKAKANLDITIVTNRPYVVGYDENRRDPLWAAYKLKKVDKLKKLDRPEIPYAMDDQTRSKVPTGGYFGNPKEPKIGNSVWVHGHMAANDALGEIYGRDAQVATFKMSNMCPQSTRLNSGKWKTLEQKEVKYSQSFGDMWVICGPIFSEQIVPPLNHDVVVPNKYYKILLRKKNDKPQVMAIIFDYFPPVGNANEYLKEHLVSVRTVEKVTGLDFFSSLPKATEDALETNSLKDIWQP